MQSILSAVLAAIFICLPIAVISGDEVSYTTHSGDTLQKLANEYGIDSVRVEDLQKLNNLKDARQIPPGTKIRFDLGWVKIKPLQVQAVTVSGKVIVTRANQQTTSAVKSGDGFKPGDVLETGGESSALLEFGDGSRLLLQGGSHMVFEVLEAYGDRDVPNIRLYLRRGRVETGVAPNDSPDRRFEIKTPVGSAGARGTSFRVGADAQLLHTEVTHGKVAVSGGGEEIPVVENFGTVAELGRSPIPPVPLLPPPDLSSVKKLYHNIPLRVEWAPARDDKGYRVRISRVSEPDMARVDRVIEGPLLSVDRLDDGDYVLMVRAVDLNGLEGISAMRHFTLDAHPLPPVLSEPLLQQRLRHSSPVFLWEGSSDAVAYRLQISSSALFTDPLIDIDDLRSASYTLEKPLALQRYYWRVASRDAAGKQGPYSNIFQFDVSQPPTPPRDMVIGKGDTNLNLSWQAGKQGQRYHLQLARDLEFSDLLEDRETTQPNIVLARPQGKSYLRMRTLGVDGYPGSFSQPVEIVQPMKNHALIILLGIAGLVLLL